MIAIPGKPNCWPSLSTKMHAEGYQNPQGQGKLYWPLISKILIAIANNEDPPRTEKTILWGVFANAKIQRPEPITVATKR